MCQFARSPDERHADDAGLDVLVDGRRAVLSSGAAMAQSRRQQWAE
jgi:hypothetical protein